jgi:pyridoxamine 5'-phosphate oxidase
VQADEREPAVPARASSLDERTADANPLALFRAWFDEAVRSNLPEPTGMTLSTATREGRPSARLVLLKHYDERGFVFFTSYESRKARELAENPRAALTFWWAALQRQVRIEGRVETVEPAQSDAYFRLRPRGSQVGAAASYQSRTAVDRDEIDRRFAEFEARFAGREIPRPADWGGYRVAPDSIEFWQGRDNRLHDRLRYSRLDAGWKIARLWP